MRFYDSRTNMYVLLRQQIAKAIAFRKIKEQLIQEINRIDKIKKID